MSGSDSLCELTAMELAALVRRREVSCLEVTDAHLTRIERLNGHVNAFCTVTASAARTTARRADRTLSRGEAAGPLHGIPVALKDLTPLDGVRLTRGSRLYRDNVAEHDASLVRRIKRAGAVILGKTNTPEFGHKAVTSNLLFGATRNPWRTDRVAGGSSGGSAAAVASGMVPLAEGSDGAGSIRIPASMCGIVGFKPSFGRVPVVVPSFSEHMPFFHNGPMARSVADATFFFQALAGLDHSQPFSVPPPQDACAALAQGAGEGIRIAVSEDLGYFPVDADVRRVCRNTAAVLESMGCEVERVNLALPEGMERDFRTLWSGKLASTHGQLPSEELELLEPRVRELIDEGLGLSAAALGRANLARADVWDRLGEVHRDFDLLLCPTTAVSCFEIGRDAPDRVAGQSVDPLLGWILTYPFNMTGNPAASIPCGTSADGLPIGMQLIGRRLDDTLVLRASHAFEQAAPWRQVAPPPSDH